MLRRSLVLAMLGIAALTAFAADRPGPNSTPDLNNLSGIRHLVYFPDGKSLLIERNYPPNANGDPRVGVWDVETGKHRVEMDKPPKLCEQIAVSPDGKKAAAISASGKQLKVWDSSTGKLLEEFQLPEWKNRIQYAPFLAFAPGGDTLISIVDKKILHTKLGGTLQFLPNEVEKWSPELTAYAPATDMLVIATNPRMGKKTGGELQVYDLTKPGDPQTIPLPGWVQSIALSPDGKTLAVSNAGGPSEGPGKVELWDASTWKVQAALPLDKRKDFAMFSRFRFSSGGKVFLGQPEFYSQVHHAADLVDLQGKILREIVDTHIFSDAAFAPDGKTVAIVVANDPIYFLDATTGKDKEP